jgi:hypothetical protein
MDREGTRHYASAAASVAGSRLLVATLVLLCTACPQLLDDGFRVQIDAPDGRDAAAPPIHPPAMELVDTNPAGAAPDAAALERDAAVLAGDTPDSSPSVDANADAAASGDADAGAEPARACRSGSHATASGACYALFETKLTWASARTRCQAQGTGWELASIRSGRDSEVLLPLVTSDMWVGATDQELEGSWHWLDNASVFWRGSGALDGAYVNWDSNEPNGNDPADCMRILPGARWADFQCANALGYICMGPQE